jgi:3,4-dihydroxy 2-butanone 4-phosphate synthase/GTP cyclohydrolase II
MHGPSLHSHQLARAFDRALAALAAGDAVVLIDEALDSADLVGAGAGVSAALVNFFAKEGRGLICVALPGDQIDRLGLRPMSAGWEQPRKAFTVSVDARQGITTGISAKERAHTICTAVTGFAQPHDLVVPGHVFPLRARRLEDAAAWGRTEAAVALVQMAGRGAGAAICELLDDEGAEADAGFARRFARQHGLPCVTLKAVAAASRDRTAAPAAGVQQAVLLAQQPAGRAGAERPSAAAGEAARRLL